MITFTVAKVASPIVWHAHPVKNHLAAHPLRRVRPYTMVGDSDWRRQVLGVSRTASEDDIRRAFRQQALKLHPDVAAPGAASDARFIELSAAYKSLLQDNRPGGDGQQWDVPRDRGFLRTALRSRTTTLWLCGAALVGGVGIFAGALWSHQLLFGRSNYTQQHTSKSAVVHLVQAKRRAEREASSRAAHDAATQLNHTHEGTPP